MTSCIIDTPRLMMREFTLDDAAAVLRFATDPQVNRYTGDSGRIASIEDARQLIETAWLSAYRQHGFARYALICKQDSQLIGFCGIKVEPLLNRGAGGIDIGYRMLPDYWGRGYATEAVKACIDYAHQHLGISKIEAEVLLDNIASQRVLEKAGMTLMESYSFEGEQIKRYQIEFD
ncbi:GNAT family N-acetyltransferase [Shewanella sp. Isolate11]|uniref:GNAT family N-acetyltransferase n=1 Tax=Shewanella sp. Isolate11 TaxID=2908530 RepID=UPI001EFCC0F9|nr:GNAT family N-acetyltransferase [Shewanella sp. Isolate11]MCG9696198.1 GNAT family N-acetyltransferase [Shewanella sp. Isolate11]